MELNYDCMRDILIELEGRLQFDDNLNRPCLNLRTLHECMVNDYSLQDVMYSSKMLKQAMFIEIHIIEDDFRIRDIRYYDITYEGHQYLEKIRSNNVWNGTKKVCSKIGAVSIDIITKIATDMLTNLISQNLI